MRRCLGDFIKVLYQYLNIVNTETDKKDEFYDRKSEVKVSNRFNFKPPL